MSKKRAFFCSFFKKLYYDQKLQFQNVEEPNVQVSTTQDDQFHWYPVLQA